MWRVRPLTPAEVALFRPDAVFAHPEFLAAHADVDPGAALWALEAPGGAVEARFPARAAGTTWDLCGHASFWWPVFRRRLSLFDALAATDALCAHAVAADLSEVQVTLPPSIYGDWVDTWRFALRARGFGSTTLRLSPTLDAAALRDLARGGGHIARGLRRLSASGHAVERIPPEASAQDALHFIDAYYAGRGRALSEPAARLARYRLAGLPVELVGVRDAGGALRLAAAFYRFGGVWLYLSAGRDLAVRESLLAFALHALPDLARAAPEVRLDAVDLGAAGYARPDFDFAGHPTIRFKEQLHPHHAARETLSRPARPAQ